jgi:hypothetical protein
LDGGLQRFGLLVLLPLLYCVSLVRHSPLYLTFRSSHF